VPRFHSALATTLGTLPIDPATLHLFIDGCFLCLTLVTRLLRGYAVVAILFVPLGGAFFAAGHLVYLFHDRVTGGTEESDLVGVLATERAERESGCYTVLCM
jgi:xanthine/uracil/vitamin C permease (AzgA family)